MDTGKWQIIPGAKRLIRSLRDMGYEFSAAVADLIDNSIEARANTIRIDVEWDGEESYVMISDNGLGMTAGQIREALKFGAERDYDAEDLGKFGLGLKTASLSQCLRLTVASRQNENRADINAYCWDLDHVDATNKWEILQVKTGDLPSKAKQYLKEAPGTVVVWERIDRILGYKRPDGEFARKQLINMCRGLEEHIAMVFHRFLAGEVRGKRLAIYLNENKVIPWDPFARNESFTQRLEQVVVRVDTEKGKSDVVIEPFVLPPQSKFSTPDAFNRSSGPSKWNRQQGFYIYRADRMIQSGGWSNLRTLDEHHKLARVALSFSPRLDDDFKINVPKMRVALPASIRDDIAKAIGPVVTIANRAYRSNEKTERAAGKSNGTPVGETPNKSIDTTGNGKESNDPRNTRAPGLSGGGSATSSKGMDFGDLELLLERVALPEELPVIKKVVARAKASITE
ncbi:ATP-binding protein [Pseudomonas sp. REP124]|uniref:ATP-binding protein n=1 Tax=Pseudomonas sp. REP124 TaxID=2875731 RepID=UPI001CC907E2|nr:ATP-binding protein [Pseudomonas sp. REP124]MBZ9784274.1 ATP-binding protein [Pseudomonas sp. REP124]